MKENEMEETGVLPFQGAEFVTDRTSRRSYSSSPSPPRGYRRRERSPSPRGRYGGCGRDLPTSLLVRNLHHDCRPEDLRKSFGKFGVIKDIYLPRDYYTGEPRGFGFVQFDDPNDATEAKYQMDGRILLGRELTVVFAEESRKRPADMMARERSRGRSYGYRSSSRYSRSPQYSRSPSPRRWPRYSRSPSPRYSRPRSARGRSYGYRSSSRHSCSLQYSRSPSPRRWHRYSRSPSPRYSRPRSARYYSRSPSYVRSLNRIPSCSPSPRCPRYLRYVSPRNRRYHRERSWSCSSSSPSRSSTTGGDHSDMEA